MGRSIKRGVVKRVLLPYWRLTRGMTVGVQGVIMRDDHVLLIRHGYQPGWHFPGGGVEWRETLATALAREVEEETGVVVKGQPRLHGVFANFRTAPSDHVALYVVDEWDQPVVPEPTFEIKDQGLFPRTALPEGTVGSVRRRLAEICDGQPIGEHW